MNKNVLAVAGFDPTGAAGIVADLKTFQIHRLYGLGVLTAVTGQNSQGVQAVYPLPMEQVAQQLESTFSDMEIHAVKVGMLANATNVEIVASILASYKVPLVVVDPVLKAGTGEPLLDEAGVAALKEKLLPMADLITPNLEEATLLSGVSATDPPSMKEAAKALMEMGPKQVVVTGGHLENRATDVYTDGKRFQLFDAARQASQNTRGIGCVFASYVTCLLVRGIAINEAVDKAKRYIAKAMVHPFKIGKADRGPLNLTLPAV